MSYRRCGRSGLELPPISLGLWWNFGHDRPFETSRAIVRRAFDLGVTHFDLANNYGPPYGSAEENFGRLLRDDLKPFRDELVVSTKAGYDMWPGPYGDRGSRKYLLASLDQSIDRLGLEYVDIFYSHRFDPDTPLEETMGALDAAVRQGKALYAGISSYSAEKTHEAAAILDALGTRLLIHQPSYSMPNRWIEPELLDAIGELGVGCIAFSPLAQGMLTDKYVGGIPDGSRASRPGYSLSPSLLDDEALAKIRALNEIAAGRGQSLAQMALAWVLRDSRVTSALIGASSVAQLEENLAAADRLDFTDDELGRSTATRPKARSTSGPAPARPDRAGMARPELPTGTVTFLFTDVEGSTRLLQEHGAGYADLLAEHRRALREAFAQARRRRGRHPGRRLLRRVRAATDAVAAAAEAREALERRPDPRSHRDPHGRAAS